MTSTPMSSTVGPLDAISNPTSQYKLLLFEPETIKLGVVQTWRCTNGSGTMCSESLLAELCPKRPDDEIYIDIAFKPVKFICTYLQEQSCFDSW